MARRTTTGTSIAKTRSKVFVDTGGWYAVSVTRDRRHKLAIQHYATLLDSDALLIPSDYVLDETITRLRYDSGHDVSIDFLNQIEQAADRGFLSISRVDERVWSLASDLYRKYIDQEFSFTDCTSFILALEAGVDEIFAFDHHFNIMGFLVRPTE
jgi:predicted nucleic acid-binding protein